MSAHKKQKKHFIAISLISFIPTRYQNVENKFSPIDSQSAYSAPNTFGDTKFN